VGRDADLESMTVETINLQHAILDKHVRLTKIKTINLQHAIIDKYIRLAEIKTTSFSIELLTNL
jgi:hypothetical protein